LRLRAEVWPIQTKRPLRLLVILYLLAFNAMEKPLLNRILSVFILVWSIFWLMSCGDSEPGPSGNTVTLVKAEYLGTHTASSLKLFIPLAGINVSPDVLQYDADIYKVTYRTHFKGSEVVASGLIGLPKTTVPVSMVSVHHGTIAAHSDAPSEQPMVSEEALLCGAFASVGLMVVFPDYIGFGSSSNILHPYYVEEPTAMAVVDNLKAAVELAAQKNLTFNKNLFLTGYSEGGYVTMAAHKYLEENPSSDFNLIASFPAAGGYDIKAMQEYLFEQDTYSDPYYLAYVAYAYKLAYDWTQPLSDFFNEPYAGKIPELFNGTLGGGQINEQLTTSIPDLVQADLLANIDTDLKYWNFADALQLNSLTDWTPTKKMFLYHGDADVTVPFQNSELVYAQLLDNGASQDVVKFIPLEGATHATGIAPYIEDVVLKILDLNF
jgi:pimeloyl-ACP methyl ester carboxylesterase